MRAFLIPYMAGMWGMAFAAWENPNLHPLAGAAICTAICTAIAIPAALLLSRLSTLEAMRPRPRFSPYKPHHPEVDAALMTHRPR